MNPYEKYRQQVVTTMTQGEMLLKLFDETIRQIGLGRLAINEGRIADMDAALNKAGRIVRYLRSSLDFRFEVSGNLSKLYEYFNSQLVAANVKKDVKPLDDIEPLVRELRDTFDQCAKLDRVKRSTAAVGNVV